MNAISQNSQDIEHTIIESVNHIIENHPQLTQPLFNIVLQKLGIESLDINFVFELNKDLLLKSKSQLRQDLFVLHELGYKRDGYFIEFGATNGFDLSNSFMLEKHYGWSGILAEPATIWHEALQNNRLCHIEKNCVWSKSGETLFFNQVDIAELSTINAFSECDGHVEARKNGSVYEVTTISLNDLLKKYNAPFNIDYLSIDTEGSEFDILSNFDFNQYDIKVITCEHNYTPMRDKIFNLLTSYGYQRKFENISQFDDWYVKL